MDKVRKPNISMSDSSLSSILWCHEHTQILNSVTLKRCRFWKLLIYISDFKLTPWWPPSVWPRDGTLNHRYVNISGSYSWGTSQWETPHEHGSKFSRILAGLPSERRHMNMGPVLKDSCGTSQREMPYEHGSKFSRIPMVFPSDRRHVNMGPSSQGFLWYSPARDAIWTWVQVLKNPCGTSQRETPCEDGSKFSRIPVVLHSDRRHTNMGPVLKDSCGTSQRETPYEHGSKFSRILAVLPSERCHVNMGPLSRIPVVLPRERRHMNMGQSSQRIQIYFLARDAIWTWVQFSRIPVVLPSERRHMNMGPNSQGILMYFPARQAIWTWVQFSRITELRVFLL
jgi:hypothetical protein